MLEGVVFHDDALENTHLNPKKAPKFQENSIFTAESLKCACF